ncbi:MAG: hypothetical protein ACE5H2_07850 [Terriglobia bacterium]
MRSRGISGASVAAGLLLLLGVASPSLWAGLPAAAGKPKPPKLSPENRFAIVRSLAFEYASTRKPLPAGKLGLELNAKGEVNQRKLRQQLANYGAALQTGDIAQITGIEFEGDHIIFEINGGGKAKKKKWHERIRITVGGAGASVPVTGQQGSVERPPHGSTIVMRFSGYIPDLTPEEVRSRLGVVLDFSRRTAAVPWIETLPEEFQEAIREKRAVVGMNREMVLAALGRPNHKVRETRDAVEEEDWIYGHPPFVTFVTFVGDEVVRVKKFK